MTAALPPRFRLLPDDPQVGWVPYVWLLYLTSLFWEPFVRGAPALDWWAAVVAVLLFLPAYFRGFWVRGPRLRAMIVVQVLIGVALSTRNFGAGVFFVYAAAAAARDEPDRVAWRGIVAIWLVAIGTSWALDQVAYHWVSTALLVPLIGAVSWHFESRLRIDRLLRAAQADVVRMAAVAERERIARDLHDVLGHSLTLVVLKAELASRLADRDMARAVHEIRELEQVARRTLGEVRDAIRGYRATWEDEVTRARAILETAGVRAEFSGRPEALDRAAEEMLALAVREAVTNVVRHAGATECRVSWAREGGRGRLEVLDDGIGVPLGDAKESTAARRADDRREGTGLLGLRERVEALGGAVEIGPRAQSRGTRLAIEVPLAGVGA